MTVLTSRLIADDERLNQPGPFRKFYLTKQYRAKLNAAGYSNQRLKEMSCAELEAAIIPILRAEG